MTDLPLTIGAFLVAIGVLVTVHEFGHFWVARRLGVKVLRFSLGFGRPLLTWRRRGDPTEYVLAMLPLGGYVKMVDEREEEVSPEDLPFAFNRQALWKRAAIVAAGPLFNFMLAFVLYWAVLVSGESGIRPEVGEVAPDSIAAAARFAPGDEILAVDGQATPTWSAVWFALLEGALGGADVSVRVRPAAGGEAERRLPAEVLAPLDPGRDFLAAIGLNGARLSVPPVLGELVPEAPAALAGLRSGDRISSVDGQSMTTWDDFVERVRASPDIPLRLGIERAADTLEVTLTPRPFDLDGERIGRIGAAPEVPEALLLERQVRVRHGPVEALGLAARRVFDMSSLTLRIMGRMLIGQASIQNLSSPIGIADAAGKTATYGIEPFAKFLAILSVSLGLLNLLPIPVLDGGHLLFYAIEAVRGRPLSEQWQEHGQRVGLALLIGLMTLAFYVDVARLLGE